METITAAMSTVTELVGTVFTAMTANAYLTVILAASLLGLGIGVFKRLRGASRG